MFPRRSTATLVLVFLTLLAPLLGQSRQDQAAASRPEAPSSRLVPYRGNELEISYPDNWTVTKTSTAVTLTPEDGIVSGSLAYGMLVDIFEPRTQDADGGSTLDATDQLIQELQRSNPNLRVVRKVQKRIGGDAALEVEMTNESPVGGREFERLTAVMRSRNKLHYFLAVAPQSEANRYSAIFERMISSIRFYN